MNQPDRHLLALAAQIVTAQVRNNATESAALPSLIENIYATLRDIGQSHPGAPSPQTHTLREVEHHHANGHTHGHADGHNHAPNGYVHPTHGQTVFEDHLVCLEDGLTMKMLKRHLQTVHGMTPAEYRAKWGLPPDYPMVTTSYAQLRSNLAVKSGLGLKPDARANRQRKGR